SFPEHWHKGWLATWMLLTNLDHKGTWRNKYVRTFSVASSASQKSLWRRRELKKFCPVLLPDALRLLQTCRRGWRNGSWQTLQYWELPRTSPWKGFSPLASGKPAPSMYLL
ncbi:mCG145332, partial [Mus musculus]